MSNNTPPLMKPFSERTRFCILIVITLALAALNAYVWGVFSEHRPLPPGGDEGLEAPTERSFDDASDKLQASIVLATLERPIPAGNSAIWCVTFPMAWQELEKAMKGPVRVANAEAIGAELSNTPRAELDPKHYYAIGGNIQTGILDKIDKDLKDRFPEASILKRIDKLKKRNMIGYAYLEVALLFDHLFHHDETPLLFKDAAGKQTNVHAFGLRERDKNEGGHSREQVLVLFRDRGEFAVDLSHNTKPYQIMLARIERKPTLKETLAELDARIAKGVPKHLSPVSVMLVPCMNWRIEHSFKDLEGPIVNMFGWEVTEAAQSIQFKLNRRGAYLVSESVMIADNGHPEDPRPEYFLFDQPFLLVMKKRGTQQPFFVMWVDNAELLQRR